MTISLSGVGGNGISSHIGDLTVVKYAEVNQFLCSLKAKVTISKTGEYTTYKFPDLSSITIRNLDGRVSRLPSPKYSSDGRNINKGLRLDKDGNLLKTRDQFNNPIPNTHNTEEYILC
jgi:hypothetical protein